MPKGRMLNKKISQDNKVAKLSIEATLLYTWCIPHLDIRGRMYGDVWTLKAITPYVDEITPQKIEKCIKEWVEAGLVDYYGNEQKYLQFKGFEKNQTLREDRESPSEIPTPTELQQNSSNTPAQVKLSKVKLSKEKEEAHLSFLSSNQCYKKLQKKFPELDIKGIIRKCEEFTDYCKSKGRVYKDYLAAIRNAIRRDQNNMPKKKIEVKSPKHIEFTEEQLKKRREALDKIKKENPIKSI